MWDNFKETGNVKDYIEYVQAKNNIVEVKSNEENSERDCDKGGIC